MAEKKLAGILMNINIRPSRSNENQTNTKTVQNPAISATDKIQNHNISTIPSHAEMPEPNSLVSFNHKQKQIIPTFNIIKAILFLVGISASG